MLLCEEGKEQHTEAELNNYGIHVVGVEGSRWSLKAAKNALK